jgi:hypothetical protein
MSYEQELIWADRFDEMTVMIADMADRIEELEAKLSKAVEALRIMRSTYPYSPPCHDWEMSRSTQISKVCSRRTDRTRMTFDEWLDEIEVFASRLERLYGDFPEVEDREKLLKWLEAAYNVGYDRAKEEE